MFQAFKSMLKSKSKTCKARKTSRPPLSLEQDKELDKTQTTPNTPENEWHKFGARPKTRGALRVEPPNVGRIGDGECLDITQPEPAPQSHSAEHQTDHAHVKLVTINQELSGIRHQYHKLDGSIPHMGGGTQTSHPAYTVQGNTNDVLLIRRAPPAGAPVIKDNRGRVVIVEAQGDESTRELIESSTAYFIAQKKLENTERNNTGTHNMERPDQGEQPQFCSDFIHTEPQVDVAGGFHGAPNAAVGVAAAGIAAIAMGSISNNADSILPSSLTVDLSENH